MGVGLLVSLYAAERRDDKKTASEDFFFPPSLVFHGANLGCRREACSTNQSPIWVLKKQLDSYRMNERNQESPPSKISYM
jgi:hypothetical protein